MKLLEVRASNLNASHCSEERVDDDVDGDDDDEEYTTCRWGCSGHGKDSGKHVRTLSET